MADNGAFTRGALVHQYYPAPVYTVRTPGAIRVSMRLNNSNPWTQGIPQVWPVTRPSTAPMPNGAPFYINGYPINSLQRASSPGLRLPPVVREMDPSNPDTWQRDYRFT